MHGLQGTYGTKAGLIPHPSSINIWYPQMIAKLLKEIGVVSDKFETMEMIIEILQGGQDARVVG
jgi:hypothetical protein